MAARGRTGPLGRIGLPQAVDQRHDLGGRIVGQTLVQQHAARVQVRSLRRRLALTNLWRHVLERPDYLSGLSDPGGVVRLARSRSQSAERDRPGR